MFNVIFILTELYLSNIFHQTVPSKHRVTSTKIKGAPSCKKCKETETKGWILITFITLMRRGLEMHK